MLWRAKPDQLLKDVSPRTPFTIVFAILLSLIAIGLGFGAWAALQELLATPAPLKGPEVGPPLTTSDRAWLFAIVLALFAFFARAAIIVGGGVVTGRAARAALVPWWFALLFVAGMSALAVMLAVIGFRSGDLVAMRGALKVLVFVGILAVPVAMLRRAQSEKSER